MTGKITITQTTECRIGLPDKIGKTRFGVYDVETAKRIIEQNPDEEIFALNENNYVLGQIATIKEAECIFSNDLTGEKRKALYDYKCDMCQGIIHKGEYYDSSRGMTATSKNENGESERKYYTFRTHLHDCTTPIECQKGNHVFEYRKEKGNPNDLFSDYLSAGTFCINCFKEKTE